MKNLFKDSQFYCSKNHLKIIFTLLVMSLLIINSNVIVLLAFSQEVDANNELTSPQPSQQQPIFIADFFEPGCHDCERVEQLLNQISFEYPEIEIRKFDISTHEGVALAEKMGEFYQVPEYDRLLVPLIYLGDKYLLREQITYENVIDTIATQKAMLQKALL